MIHTEVVQLNWVHGLSLFDLSGRTESLDVWESPGYFSILDSVSEGARSVPLEGARSNALCGMSVGNG